MIERVDGRVVLGWLCALLIATPVAAQDAEPSESEAVEAVEAVDALASTDRAALSSAFATIGRTRHEPAVVPLSDRVRRGLPPDLLVLAVLTLAELGRPEAGPILFELTRHRRAEVRVTAIDAIVATRPAGTTPVLARMLGDPSPDVRGGAATALGVLEARDALDLLIAALAAGVPQAGFGVGRLVDDERVPRVIALIDRLDIGLVLPALEEILGRTSLSEASRLAVLTGLEERRGPELLAFLGQFVSSPEAEGGDAIREAARSLLARLSE